MDTKTNQLDKYRENAFFIALLLVAAVFPFSEALVSIGVGVLLAQVLVLQSWKHPSVNWTTTKIALFPVSIFFIYLIGTAFTNDFSFALYELKKTIFWAVVPLAMFLSPRLNKKQTYIVLFVFVSSVALASFIYAGKLVMNQYFNVADFRSLSIISHIRFSLQVVLALILLSWFIYRKGKLPVKTNVLLFWSLLLWLTLFLVLLKSLIGILAFLGVLLVFLIIAITRTRKAKPKFALIAGLVLAMLIPSVYIGTVVQDYYNFETVHPEEIDMHTASGNPYHHDFNQGMRENGNLVYVYVCEEELRQEWNKRSDIKYDDDLNGYILGSTLIRYLTSKGYRKDSVGVSKLTSEDIDLILKGVTNYKFKNHSLSIYPRIYETIWEFDYYQRTGDPNEKSLAQRIEFIKASLIIMEDNPVFGIGTGNWVIEYNRAYDRMNTLLLKEKRSSSHNQYVNYLVKFGIIGFSWILFAILFPVFRPGHRNNYILIMFLVLYAFANLGDANMETHMGLSFFTFFYCFFLRNSTPEMKASV
ncbi:MAG: O-antigen ligase family protein [Bacteroidota bacterium]